MNTMNPDAAEPRFMPRFMPHGMNTVDLEALTGFIPLIQGMNTVDFLWLQRCRPYATEGKKLHLSHHPINHSADDEIGEGIHPS
ncbi:hypothetical protein C6496_01870 [Candidatus Poribacteria bacterium]|nr:MAG: hypothetical protein C6496_01870 [Candidatus Poribacteria bacterium]